MATSQPAPASTPAKPTVVGTSTTEFQGKEVTVNKVQLRTAYGPVFRDVLDVTPRDARSDEIPVLDFKDADGTLDQKKALAEQVKIASMRNGFFYLKNHGLSEEVIKDCKDAATQFFAQDLEPKNAISKLKGKHLNGYTANGAAAISPQDGYDFREHLAWRYQPKYDPIPKNLEDAPEKVQPWIRGNDFVWDGTSHLPGFKEKVIKYWQDCITLSRRLVHIFALALDLPEDHFDHILDYPAADGAFNYYPGLTEEQAAANMKTGAGLGAHTDPQCFALLYQDLPGLQVLTTEGQWIRANPIPDTLIINIGDYIQRLTNSKFKSSVHRVFNASTTDR